MRTVLVMSGVDVDVDGATAGIIQTSAGRVATMRDRQVSQ